MLDFDLAEMYGVETKNLNLSVKRNARRFPSDFMLQLTEEEWHSLRLQIATSKRGGRRYIPYAFTEQGVAMLSGLLNSDIAIEININIMRAFVAVRRFIMSPPVNEVKQLQDEVKELKGYIEEVFADYNDMNEDTRLQLDLINEALAELQMKNRQVNRTRNPVGYVRPEE
jgi:ORF6N domain